MAEPVWEGRLPFAGGAAFLLPGLHPPVLRTPVKRVMAARSITIFLAIYGSITFCFLLPLCLSSHTHTHTHTRFSLSFVKDKGALPRVPPPTLSHVISVLTHSNICSIKTSSHTVLISYWQREVNVPILLCFN